MKADSTEKNLVFGWFGPAAGAAIFRIIKKTGPLSRAAIVRETGLSKSTVSMHVEKLIKMGLICEEDHDQHSNLGRKGLLLKFAVDSGFIIGIDLGATSLYVALCNLDAEIIDSRSEDLLVSIGPERVMERVVFLIDALLTEHDLKVSGLLGIGMGVPGPVEFATGIPVSPPIMPGWHRYPIRSVLQTRYHCPVYIDNDVNVMAMGEKYYGLSKNIDNFIFVKIGTGIGAGIFCNGKLYRGSQGCAGDIGHIGVDGVELLCPCGNKGCLEIVAAGPAIGLMGKEAAEKGQSKLLLEKLNQQGYITAKDVGSLAEHGDLACVEIIQASGRTIGQVLAKLINFFNPSLIIIGGGVSGLGVRFLAAIKEVVYQRSLPLATRELQIQFSMLKKQAGVIGAAAMALEEIFSHNNVTEMVYQENKRIMAEVTD
jgi:glucokinase-like ROK family protein